MQVPKKVKNAVNKMVSHPIKVSSQHKIKAKGQWEPGKVIPIKKEYTDMVNLTLTNEQKNLGRKIAHDLNRWADVRDLLNENKERQGKKLNSHSLRRAVKWILDIINKE